MPTPAERRLERKIQRIMARRADQNRPVSRAKAEQLARERMKSPPGDGEVLEADAKSPVVTAGRKRGGPARARGKLFEFGDELQGMLAGTGQENRLRRVLGRLAQSQKFQDLFGDMRQGGAFSADQLRELAGSGMVRGNTRQRLLDRLVGGGFPQTGTGPPGGGGGGGGQVPAPGPYGGGGGGGRRKSKPDSQEDPDTSGLSPSLEMDLDSPDSEPWGPAVGPGSENNPGWGPGPMMDPNYDPDAPAEPYGEPPPINPTGVWQWQNGDGTIWSLLPPHIQEALMRSLSPEQIAGMGGPSTPAPVPPATPPPVAPPPVLPIGPAGPVGPESPDAMPYDPNHPASPGPMMDPNYVPPTTSMGPYPLPTGHPFNPNDPTTPTLPAPSGALATGYTMPGQVNSNVARKKPQPPKRPGTFSSSLA